ncbi:hypothetical protein CONCODRAFT_8456 [Conidiobolus coronatus NRRL 28638]|uniref:Uncharacterized protein n=1 Tax=Conidiobolus coronatus (strain ATCC 28846 / CBS 209.66 / NRRL 28638) TaxID=796925 RepID=A0A137P2I0_CONC2|nr:hypothetical protein CONCODRAFT_8456 [Conidiobolus coronatus NRRL 28638]|eukprot:KXN69168.1 hypothetical protein CONCODRAFT_8456 [Conidiobolus coronatus NRRL 28638]
MTTIQEFKHNPQIKIKSPRRDKKLQHFRTRWSIWQLLYVSIQAFAALLCLILIVSCYLISIPTFELTITTLNKDPSLTLDLSQFPNIVYYVTVYAKVENKNIFPLPVSFTAKASIASENPADYLVTASATIVSKNMKTATLALDACGMFGSERTGLIGNMKATAYFGYGVVSIPLKTLVRNNMAIICPLLEQNLAELLLGLLNGLLPFEEQYNGTLNDELNKNNNMLRLY